MTRPDQLHRDPSALRTTWPVVVAGAGPAGLTAAITLASAGIACLVVDRHAGPAPHPRATVLSVRTMELLRSWQLEPAVAAGACDVELQMRVVPTLAEAARGSTVDVGYPTRAQARTISPTAPLCVPQDHVEATLISHLASLPAATIRRQVAVRGLQPFDGGQVVELGDVVTGSSRFVHARFVIGADGAHSTVRELLGIPTRTTPSVFDGTSVVFHAPLWDLVGPHRYGLYAIEHPDAAGTLLPAGADDRWVYAFAAGVGSPPGHDAHVDRLSTAVGRPLNDVRITGVQQVSFVGAIADRFRAGPVFLVGDAAHRVTPRGGTGLNTAIADGFDLGWKLAWVLRGWAPAALLDTFEAERRAVAEHQLARSIEPDGSRCDSTRALAIDLGGRIRHAWLPDGRERSTLDLIGDGVTVFHHGRRNAPGGPGVCGVPVRHVELDALTARALGILPGGHLAVRPDGVPTGHLGGRPTEAEKGRTYGRAASVTLGG